MDDKDKKEENGSIKTPVDFLPESAKSSFDYDKYQDETTVKATIELLKCLGKNADLLAYNHDVENGVIVENMGKVAQEMMNIIIDCKVPDSDMQKLTDMMAQIPFQLFNIISRQKNEFEKELLARFIGVRDPGTQKYSREFASMGDMFQALIKLRETQGNNVEDYYTLTKKPDKE